MWLRPLSATACWWLQHPWLTFWLGVTGFWGWALLVGFVDAPLHAVVARALGGIVTGAVVVILPACFCRGVWVSWRHSKVGALVKVGVPVALLTVSGAVALSLMHEVQQKVRLATDQHTAEAMRSAVARAYTRQGAFPPTRAAVNALLSPPPRWLCTRHGPPTYDPQSGKVTLDTVLTDC